MSTNPEHLPESDIPATDAVTWIGRDRPPPFERAPEPHAVHPPAGPMLPTAQDADGARRKWLIRGVVLAVVLVIAIMLWVARPSKPALVALADKTQAPLISVMTPALKAVISNVTFSGGIAARYDMPIGNDGDTGRVVAVYVEAGDHVRRGQILAKLDDSVVTPQVNRLAASLEQARAQAELSQAEYKRALGVAAAGALSAEDIEKRRATAVTDAANVKVAAAQLAESQARLRRTRITAPIDGVVLTRKAEVGQIANPGGEALFRVASGGEVEMRGQLAEQDLAQVKVGDAATVYLTGLPRAFSGRVRLLGAIIDPATRLGEIRIALAPDPALRPGAFARGSVIVGRAQRPVVPQTAVLADTAGSYVFIVNRQGKAERRAVHVADTGGDGIVIGSGLAGTEQVVTTAGGFLRDGEPVRVASGGALGETR
ncbi:MAG: efflux RND transporter periplasmic adaptor subunit [Steroidobacteraceae bacterium]